MARLRTLYRIVAKLSLFFLFGLGSVILGFIVFPAIRLCSSSGVKFKRRSRLAVCRAMRIFVFLGRMLGGFRLYVEDREYLSRLGGHIVVANHPSLLDIVMLLSAVPNADCIIKASLGRGNIVRNIVNTLYIPNSLDFDQLAARCTKSLAAGNCLIIFPEGTRTKADGVLEFRKGAARISLMSGAPIVPVCICGNDKYGLRKGDRILSYNPDEEFVYIVKPLSAVYPSEYSSSPLPAAARKITERIRVEMESALNR